MKIRSSIQLNGRSAQLLLFPALQEPPEHLVLKLAAYLFFFDASPTVEMGPRHPGLQGQDYWPDLLGVDEAGQVRLWVECGKTTLHKLEKVSRRFRDADVVVLTPQPQQAEQQAKDVASEGLRGISVWTFDAGEFRRWSDLVTERNDIIGEASRSSLNLVINDQPYFTELRRVTAE